MDQMTKVPKSDKKKMLVYGATGRAGSLVVKQALEQGWSVSAFVRNPDRLPDALRSKVNVIVGNLCDAQAITAAVRSSAPTAIVDASSAIPIGHVKGQPANNADRNVITRATVAALETDGRLSDCVLLIFGGQLIPEPGGKINSWSVAALAWVLRTIVARKAWREIEKALRWTFRDTPPSFRFIYARMGMMVEAPSKGTLVAEPTSGNIQRGSASYVDVAAAFVRLADDANRTWDRKALFFNYAGA